ncbi:MAG: hypothetical protein IJT66_03590 [Clostridia bacterium]|nr:hypothetical protein [Clostridia bacterium]
MKKRNREFFGSILITVLLVLFALVCHSVARRVELPEFSRFLNFIRTSVYIGLFSVWGVSAYRRVVQPQVRHYLVAVSILMVGWMILREIKFRFVINADIERYLWYSYYIPILLTPLIALFVSVLLGKHELYRLPKKFSLLYAPTVFLAALFLTNDLHQFAFRFPQDAPIWTEHGDYRYGAVFYAAMAWGVFCSLAAMIVMIAKSRWPKLRGLFWLPLMPIVLVLGYVVAYAFQLPVVAELGDIAAFESLVFISFFEICIRLGLIPSNTRYSDLFSASQELSLQITDSSYAVCYAASGTKPFEKDLLLRAENGPVLLEGGKRLHNMPIRGGHAVWVEDSTELLRQKKALQNAQTELNDRSEIVQMEVEEERKRKIVEEQNRLLDLLQHATQTQLDKVKALTDAYQASQEEEAKQKIIAEIVVLGSFIKRRKDLLLSMEGNLFLHENKLISALDESFRSLRIFGISGGYAVHTGRAEIRGDFVTAIYDFFEDVLECVLNQAHYLNVSVMSAGGGLRCSVMTDCTTPDTVRLSEQYPAMRVIRDAEGTQFLLPLEGGNAV